MVFSSTLFIFFFLPAVLLSYYVSPKKMRNGVLLIFSLAFYSWGEPVYILIMAFSTVFDYSSGIFIERMKSEGKGRAAKGILITTIMVNIGMLFFFKYSNFVITNVNAVLKTNVSLLHIALPIGISFYTFQTLSYTIDVFRGEVKAQKSIIDFSTYVTMFPQLIAGPIVQYKDIENQLKVKNETLAGFAYGIRRFVIGLFKKVVLANNIGFLWNQISTGAINELSVSAAWIGAIAFSFQIYFDFSGYSDMAVGLGKMFGFHFLENFDHPYRSKSITEFWHRWHISLGTWFREYVYIPLGGSRKGKTPMLCNLLVVWGLTGFWHGASWNFMLWGLYFAVLLIIEKLFLLKHLQNAPSWIGHLYTLLFVILSWVIFAFENMGDVATYIKAMFGANGSGFVSADALYYLATNIPLLIGCTILSMGIPLSQNRRIQSIGNQCIISAANFFAFAVLFLVSICFLVGGTYNPFLYFRF